jgi:hypothetical protein
MDWKTERQTDREGLHWEWRKNPEGSLTMEKVDCTLAESRAGLDT